MCEAGASGGGEGGREPGEKTCGEGGERAQRSTSAALKTAARFGMELFRQVIFPLSTPLY